MAQEIGFTVGLFLFGLLPFLALAWWASTATRERVGRARTRRRQALGRDPQGAGLRPASIERELRLWHRLGPVLAVVGLAAGSALAWQTYRLFRTLD